MTMDNVPLLMTRPRAASERFLAEMPEHLAHRVRPIVSPLIEIAPLDVPVTLGAADVIFTSSNGVSCAPKGDGRTAYCVGPATTRAAQDRGWRAVQMGENADTLVHALTARQPDAPLLHLTGVHTRGNVADRLRAVGLSVEQIALYNQATPEPTQDARDVLAGKATLVPVFSPRTAAQLAYHWPNTEHAHICALSRAVAQHLSGSYGSLTIVNEPNAPAMYAALEKCLSVMDMG
jgi:uroporphyrinogen-III synthase